MVNFLSVSTNALLPDVVGESQPHLPPLYIRIVFQMYRKLINTYIHIKILQDINEPIHACSTSKMPDRLVMYIWQRNLLKTLNECQLN